jgi:Sulfotransferase domain
MGWTPQCAAIFRHSNGELQLQGIISLSAFPKSGVTYLSFLLFHSLFSDECNIRELERKYILDIHAFPNATFTDPQGPRLIKLHSPYNVAIPAVRLTSKAIYLIRHPIDIMMSAWDYERLLKGVVHDRHPAAFRDYVRQWLATEGTVRVEPVHGSWIRHVRSWLGQTNIPVHLVRYEQLVDNPERELESILEFLGLRIPTARQHIAIERSSMKSMAALESHEFKNRIDGIFFRQDLAASYGQGNRFINKGYRKSYEVVLTSEERVLVDQIFGNEIRRYFGNHR